VSINLLVKRKGKRPGQARIYYTRVDEYWRKEQKYDFLDEQGHLENIAWQDITPDRRHTWLTEGLQDEFDVFLPMGTKEAKAGMAGADALFENFGSGVKTNRDNWVYNFSRTETSRNVRRMTETYNEHVLKWKSLRKKPEVDEFVSNDDSRIFWSEGLKNCLQRQITLKYDDALTRHAMYRPFTTIHLYFDEHLNERRYQMPSAFPQHQQGIENRIICVSGVGHDVFRCQMADRTVDFKFSNSANGGTQCFSFYTYAEDGTNRRENVTDWALGQFRTHYCDDGISKWDIFHYVYALLHHPQYREKYAANLKRELPRIPYAPDFRGFAQAGARLADLHVNYEKQPEYPLQRLENKDEPLNWRVEKMKLSKDKTQLVYNDFLILGGIPPEIFDYRLGNRSALDWIVDQYQVSTDKRSGIVNDPNRADDPEYIVRLIGQVSTVSLETVKIVKALPPLS
jgi:predicted helicase